MGWIIYDSRGVPISAQANHAILHGENGDDELLVEDLGTASLVAARYARTDGAGGLTIAQILHSEVGSIGAADHHAVGIPILDRDLSTVDVLNTAAETSIYSHLIPGNELGATGGVLLKIGGDYFSNTTATNFELRFKLGTTTAMLADTVITIGLSGVRRGWSLEVWFMNSATGAQKWNGTFYMSQPGGAFPIRSGGDFDGAGQGTSSEDTTADRTLDVTVKHGAAVADLSFRKEEAVLVKFPAV